MLEKIKIKDYKKLMAKQRVAKARKLIFFEKFVSDTIEISTTFLKDGKKRLSTTKKQQLMAVAFVVFDCCFPLQTRAKTGAVSN